MRDIASVFQQVEWPEMATAANARPRLRAPMFLCHKHLGESYGWAEYTTVLQLRRLRAP